MFHIAYVAGEPVKEWNQHFSFHKVDVPYGFVRSRMVRFFLSRKKVYGKVKDVDVDVFFTLSALWMQEFSRYCSRKMGVPYVVRLRGNHRLVRKAMKINVIKEKALNFLETRGLKEADLVIPNSMDLAERAVEWGVHKDKITSPVWNGVDIHMFKRMRVDRSDEFTVGYAGRISPEKRTTQILRIAEKMTDFRFLVAGKKQMAISFPSNVEYLGELPFSEMPMFYNKTDLIILPSFTEGFPNVFLEAYSCEKPVLASREAFPKELKIFGSVADVNEFEEKIRELEKSDLADLGRRARSYVKEHYSWDIFAKAIIKHLKILIN